MRPVDTNNSRTLANSQRTQNFSSPKPTLMPGVTNVNAEEVSMLVGSKKKKDKASEKKQQESLGRYLHRRVDDNKTVNLLTDLLDIASSVGRRFEKIKKLVASEEDLQSWSDSELKDGAEPADLFLALKKASFHFGEDAKCQPEIDATIRRLVTDSATSIQASFNVASVVANAYSDGSLAKKMRMAIGDGNQGSLSTKSILSMLLERFGEDDFALSLETYMQSSLKDYKSIMPSTDPIYLRDIFNNLRSTNGVKSLVSDCSELLISFQSKLKKI